MQLLRDTSAATPVRVARRSAPGAHGDRWRPCCAAPPWPAPSCSITREPIAPPQEIVALAADHLPLGLARLGFKLRLLSLDPAQLADHRQPHCVIADRQGCRHPHPAVGWIDAEVQVLDGLADDLNRQAADRDLRASQYSCWFFTSSRIRSTRSSSIRRLRCHRRRLARTTPACVPALKRALIAFLTFLTLNGLLRQSSCRLARTACIDRQRQRLVLAEVVIQRPLGRACSASSDTPRRLPGSSPSSSVRRSSPDTPGSPAPPACAARSGHPAAPTSSRSTSG